MLPGRNAGNTNTVTGFVPLCNGLDLYVESTAGDIPQLSQNDVDRAIRDQQTSWKIRQHEVNAGCDPQGVERPPVEDKMKIIRYITTAMTGGR
jgi:hypothetical protein